MVLHEHSDVLQWGLNILNGDPGYNTGYYGDITQDDTGDVYNGHYFQNHYENDCNHVENDEIIARTLQEEFSQLEIDERSRYVQEGEGQFQAPETEPAYDWHNSAMVNYCSRGHDYEQEGIDDVEPSSSCSSPCETGESSLELPDNYPLDDEVGRRLSEMILIPHVPKINGEIPSIDEATSDHQRLLDRLLLYDFVEHRVQGDGNCQFRALSDQLYHAPEHHKFVRRQLVNQLKSNSEIYDGYVPMEYGDYLAKMSKSGEWGDHVTLQAAADKILSSATTITMALELVGGALLSSFLQVAFDRLSSPEVLDYFKGKRLDQKLLNKLNISLLSINAVIDDAEDKHITNIHVSAWLDKVKDAVLDAEDLLDEIHTESSKAKLEAEFQTTASKVWSYFPSSVSSFDKELQSRMKEILDNLEFLASRKDILGLKEGGVGVGKKVSQRLPTTSLVDEASVCGRDDDKKAIIDLLLSNNRTGNNPTVISIVGMGGMGKTTLAQLAYNDSRMEDEFIFKAWVCVSEEFDAVRVTRTILKALKLPVDDMMDFDTLQVMLKEKLSGKKFLLVLDDVWNEDYLNWEALQTPFVYGAHGSKILVTTRSEKVSSTMRCTHLHQLKQLSEEDSWLLFSKYALRDADLTSSFKEIGKKIIEKCKGLPLALKAIGSLLYTKLSYVEWNRILSSKIWDISEDGGNIIPALRLSYQYLPSALKRCFAYCCLLPKDYEFKKDYLVELWMAENFLELYQPEKSMKELGDQFFNDLLSRSFFQRSSEQENLFVMHDLVNDLAKYVSREFCLNFEEEKEVITISKMTRHFSYIRESREGLKQFEVIYKANKLRTFLNLSRHRQEANSSDTKMIHDLLSNFKCLRVLSLCYYTNNFEVPDSIGNLKHLRYFNLSGSDMGKLPDSICSLYNLQTLKLRYCYYLEELPSDMQKLINLHHLDFRGTKVRKLPNGLGKLKKLEVLSSFYVGKCGDYNINQLAELNLRGTLAIEDLQNVADPMDAVTANLKNKIHLEKLEFRWSMNDDGSENERNVLKKLQPPANLKKLFIEKYGGTRFPDWFGDNYMSNIVSLRLIDCQYCFALPPLGILPSLKELWIVGLKGVEVIGPEFYGNNSSVAPFVSLRKLIFSRMDGWVEWDCQNASAAFPSLEKLSMSECPNLKNQLPKHLPSLLDLHIEKCMQLVASFPWAPEICCLYLRDCGNLEWESLPSTVKELSIGGQFTERSFVEKVTHSISKTCLEYLDVDNCPVVELLNCHSLNFLQTLVLTGCDTLRSFSLDFFPKLQSLRLEGCSELERLSISESLDPCLTSLTRLRIVDCPQVECGEGGLPSTLKALDIIRCPKLVASRMKWDLHTCTSLYIEDENVDSFPEQGLLPPTLTSLTLWGCSNLKTLDYKGLCHLTSLKTLWISDCPRLQCLPKEGLPSSLSVLEIRGDCPMLKQRCQKQSGEDWSKISHIPAYLFVIDISCNSQT